MNENENNFDALRQLLKLKRHETPPPGYFNHFSGQVIARIRSGEADNVHAAKQVSGTPWLSKFLQLFEFKPAFAGAFASALCLLLIFGVVYADRPDSGTQPFLPNADASTASFASVTPASVTAGKLRCRHDEQQLSNSQPAARRFAFWFGKSPRSAGQFFDLRQLICIVGSENSRCALEPPPRFSFKLRQCQPKSSPSPTKKVAWGKPPPPSISPPASPRSVSGFCSLTSIRRPTPPAASGLEKIEGASAYRVLLGEGGLLEKIKPTAYERLEIIPSEVDLCAADIELARLENHLQRLAHALKPVLDSQRFDVTIIDCPPSLGILTLNAFTAMRRHSRPAPVRVLRARRHFDDEPRARPAPRRRASIRGSTFLAWR